MKNSLSQMYMKVMFIILFICPITLFYNYWFMSITLQEQSVHEGASLSFCQNNTQIRTVEQGNATERVNAIGTAYMNLPSDTLPTLTYYWKLGSCSPFMFAYPTKKQETVFNNHDIWSSMFESNDGIWHHPYLEGVSVDYILNQCKSGNKKNLVLDIGSNAGYFTLRSASCGCHVFAFDGNSKGNAYIEYSLSLNPSFNHLASVYTRLVSNTKAVSWKSRWYTEANSAGDMGIVLDDFLQPYLEEYHILYAKYDIQGHEPQAIDGSLGLLKQSLIDYVAVEIQLLEGKYDGILDSFCKVGYSCINVDMIPFYTEFKTYDCLNDWKAQAKYECSKTKKHDQKICENYIFCSHSNILLNNLWDYLKAHQT